jgi:CBS domain containing-hemolysin-like protein
MTNYLIAILFLLIAVAGVVVRKTYYYLPVTELKRRAEHHDKLAVKLYPAVAYGSSLRGLLWLWIGLASAAGFVLLARIAPPGIGFLGIVALLWVINSWLPASRVTAVGANVTAFVTPVIIAILNRVHPLSSRGTELVEHRYTAPAHTGLFERGDLLALIEQQQRQPDNLFTYEELEITRRALGFGDHKVSDVLTPRKKIKTTLVNDTIGPVLIDELHKSGQGYMLVRESAKGDFVGTLAFKRVGLQSTGQVRNVMDKTIHYIHENDSLGQALHAFFKTNDPLLIVVNSSEEYVGIITIEGILHQLLGHIPGDDFDRYEDKTAVSARHIKPKAPKKTEKETAEAETEPPAAKSEDKNDEPPADDKNNDKPEEKSSETTTEVVE